MERLSGYILLGGTLGSGWGKGKYKDDQGNTCAWGGAFDAAGIEQPLASHFPPQAIDKWPWAFNVSQGGESYGCSCLECKQVLFRSVAQLIAHINDDHAYSREEVASWVATIEPKFEIVVEQQAEEIEVANGA